MKILWQDRKRPIFGLPLSFTVYSLDEERLFIKTGIRSIREDEVRLYRIMDITLKQSLGQRIFGVGTIHCCSADASMRDFDIMSVKNPREVKEMLSQKIEEQRMKKRVYNQEDFRSGDRFEDLMDEYDQE